MGRMVNFKKKVREYEASNQEAARIIVADPERYPGGLQQWARIAYKQAFQTPDPRRDGLSEEDWNEMSELRTWNRRYREDLDSGELLIGSIVVQQPEAPWHVGWCMGESSSQAKC